MSGRHLAVRRGGRGLGTMLGIVIRIQRRSALMWVLVLSASMTGTAVSIAALYDTPAKIHSYAAAVTAGSALVAINGRVEGIDSLGGLIQDEFGFMAAFLMPLLGISLVARATRREEEAGRLELLLGGRVARTGPTLAALLVATAAIVATGVVFVAGLATCGVPFTGSVLYALSLGTLALVFAAFAALLAQLTLHARDVYTWSLVMLAAAYVLRGVGDVTGTWVTWLSPLGWAEKVAPFGDQRWWVLLIALATSLVLAGIALRLAGARDVGSALVRSGAGPERARARLCGPIGLAVWVHRPAILGWLAGGVLLTATMGVLSQQLLDALSGNPALSEAMGISTGRPVAGFIAATQVYLTVIAAGYAVSAVGTLRTEEAEGRLEMRLSGTLSRTRWLAAHAVVVLGGLVTIMLGCSLVLGLATTVSVGDTSVVGESLESGLVHLPVGLVLAGVALALYGLHPRLFGVAWAGYATMTFIAFLGPGLELPQWVLDLSPTTHVGNPPLGAVENGPLALMVGIAVALCAGGLAGFRQRGVPRV